MTDREILDKLFHWNNEWLTRPNYATSELADTLYSNIATIGEYRDKVFCRQVTDVMIDKLRPIKQVLQRFNKKDSSTAEDPDERDLASLMKFIEDDTMKTLSKHLFAASGAMFSMATQIMTLQTLFSHPSEFAKKHRESPEVQAFKQNPSRDSMVNYIAGQTLTHNELVAYDEEGTSVWDVLTERLSHRPTQETDSYWERTEEDDEYYDEDNEEEEELAPARSKRRRVHVLEEDEEEGEENETFTTPESSGERAIFNLF